MHEAIPKEIREKVLERDKCCRFCGRTDDLVVHEIEAQAYGGVPSVDTCTTFCGYHHHILHTTDKKWFHHSKLVKEGLKNAKSNGTVLGRRKGCRDKKKRRKEGYVLRYKKKIPEGCGNISDWNINWSI